MELENDGTACTVCLQFSWHMVHRYDMIWLLSRRWLLRFNHFVSYVLFGGQSCGSNIIIWHCDVGWRARCRQTNPTPRSSSNNNNKNNNSNDNKHGNSSISSNSKNISTHKHIPAQANNTEKYIKNFSPCAISQQTSKKQKNLQTSKQVKWLSKPTRKEEGRTGLKKQVRTIKEPKNRITFWSFWQQ